jgi:pimeloyl-ACP methyl ester carboxylesterase
MKAVENEILVLTQAARLPGTLTLPAEPCGVVVFAHGSGSSRLSRRNIAVARSLVERGCATLLFDLLTPREAEDRRNVFDIELLGRRVLDATAWLRQRPDTKVIPVGYFGASTGAAAALVAAAELGDGVAAVVSRGGRPDLAGEALPRVTAPTLLLVGSLDADVLDLNRQAQRRLGGESKLAVIAGATHLFEEPGTLEEVARLAREWFLRHLPAGRDRGEGNGA